MICLSREVGYGFVDHNHIGLMSSLLFVYREKEYTLFSKHIFDLRC